MNVLGVKKYLQNMEFWGLSVNEYFKNLASGNSGNRLCSWKVDLDFEKDQINDADKLTIHDIPLHFTWWAGGPWTDWTTSTRRRRLSCAIFLFSIYHSSDCDKHGLAAYARHCFPFWSRCVEIACWMICWSFDCDHEGKTQIYWMEVLLSFGAVWIISYAVVYGIRKLFGSQYLR